MVELLLPKQIARVRFPSPAPSFLRDRVPNHWAGLGTKPHSQMVLSLMPASVFTTTTTQMTSRIASPIRDGT